MRLRLRVPIVLLKTESKYPQRRKGEKLSGLHRHRLKLQGLLTLLDLYDNAWLVTLRLLLIHRRPDFVVWLGRPAREIQHVYTQEQIHERRKIPD